MPDWSYHTVFKPLLFTLAPERARDLTLGAMGWLAALPHGYRVIEFFGHMAPPATLSTELATLKLQSPVWVEAELDPAGLGTGALARFGCGAVEVGPVTERPVMATSAIQRREGDETIWYPDLPINPGADALIDRLKRFHPLPTPVGIRLAHRPGAPSQEATEERLRLLDRLGKYADFYVLETRGGAADGTWSDEEWATHLYAMIAAAHPHPVFICLQPDLPPQQADRLLAPGIGHGVIISGGIADGSGRLEGPAAQEPTLNLLRYLTQERQIPLPVVAGGGVHDPADGQALLAAGATAVTVHSGLVYAGPGLIKRINEAVAYERSPLTPSTGGKGWIWGALLGAGLVITSLTAFLVAITSIILPYDLSFVGLSRAQLHEINSNLMNFMAHDRISFVGIGLATGIIYLYLAYFAMRHGAHWARQVILISAGWGFLSFLTPFVYGYIEPLHLLMIAICLPLYIMALLTHRNRPAPTSAPALRRDRVWYIGQWGQLFFIGLGAGILASGLVITAVGVSHVFVPQDLHYMQTTADVLRHANERLVPLIAHDRVGFGTGLVANGLAIMLTALWGFRQGERWLWWAMLVSGAPSYAAALWTHFSIGYTDFIHLLPVYVGLIVFIAALLTSFPYLMRPPGGTPE